MKFSTPPRCNRRLLISAAAYVAAASAATTKVAQIPVIHHYKEPGLGYKPQSPLYTKTVHTESLPEAPPIFGASGLVQPVSTSVKCVVNLVAQFFLVIIAKHLLHVINLFKSKFGDWSTEEKCLATVADNAVTKPSSIFFIPMLCVLFLATRMRAVQLSQGRTLEHDLPQWWVKSSMQVCSWSVLILSILVFICALLYGDTWEQAARSKSFSRFGRVLMYFRSGIILIIYAGFSLVCVGTLTMPTPAEIWGTRSGPTNSLAAICTVLLTAIYFAVYLALEVARAVNEAGILGPPRRFAPAQELLKTAAMTVAFAPMISALFIATRLRATQLGFEHGDPPSWIQTAVCICTFSIGFQTLLAIVGGFMGVQDVIVQEGGHTDLIKEHGNDNDLPLKAKVVEAMRLAAMICLYCGTAVLLTGMYIMEPAVPVLHTSGLPATLSCFVILTSLYFGAYFLLWLVLTVQRRRGPPPSTYDHLLVVRSYLENEVKTVVSVCPMLCILYLACFMRGLQVSHGRAGPPAWCQGIQCMVSFCVVLMLPARIDLLRPAASKELKRACALAQEILWGLLFVGIATILVCLFTMDAPAETPSPSGTVLSLSRDAIYYWPPNEAVP